MINCQEIFNAFQENEINFFTGIPDSLLKNICAYITDHTTSKNHIIAANEGGAIGLATGYYLATGKIPLVYFQNSGLGNTVNPIVSLATKEVYGIPMLLMIGWRGEPGVKDEPQHFKQGIIQNQLLETMDIPFRVIDKDTPDIISVIKDLCIQAKDRKSPVAMVVRKGTFSDYQLQADDTAKYVLSREDAVKKIASLLDSNDIVVSTTGKTSRELFEYRVEKKQGHDNDFLTVGSMGHASQIALGIALNSERKIVCLDGDGAAIMHLGSFAITGTQPINNFVHFLINNGAHDSVGGQPTAGSKINFQTIAKACGYAQIFTAQHLDEIEEAWIKSQKNKGPVFIEIKTRKGARENLGRPTTSPEQNKQALMNTLAKKNG